MKTNKVFISGRMEKDSDERYLGKGSYRDATNIRVLTSEDSDVGTVENIQGNKRLTWLGLTNTVCLGSVVNNETEIVYWFISADEKDALVSWNKKTDTLEYILEHTTLLNFGRIKGVNIIDDLIYWIDDRNTPRCVNIERAKGYGLDGFTELDISVLKPAPNKAPEITLVTSDLTHENNIEERFLRFAYRYEYLDGEFSAISPFSPTAFFPNIFKYNYATGSNESFVNKFNAVDIDFNTGDERVKSIDLLFKESGHDVVYLIQNFNKSELNLLDNVPEIFQFNNSKIYRLLPDGELTRFFDNVPLLANAQDLIGSELAYANYTEHYDIALTDGTPIKLDYTVDLNTTIITQVAQSLKSNRDMEIAIAYKDLRGRYTTPLTCQTNTYHIPISASQTQNKIEVTINHEPPAFATHYVFFAKQSKFDYDTILPSLFYEDGSYRWVKIDGADQNKINEGDYLIVKADSQEILQNLVKVKVLEVKQQEKNFLQPIDKTDEIVEKSGLYFKIKPKNFRLNVDDYETFNLHTYHNARRKYHNCLRDSVTDVGQAYFYGDTLDDMTTGGTFSVVGITNFDKRFTVQIDGEGTGTLGVDTFRWSIDGGANWEAETIDIAAGVPSSLSDGVEITFAAEIGHSAFDEWEFYCRTPLESLDTRAYGWFRMNGDIGATMTSSGHTVDDEIIENGARITLEYDEYNVGIVYLNIDTTSTDQYANIQEWFYRENIAAEITNQYPTFDLTNIYFMRGVLHNDPDGNAQYMTYDPDGYMTMIVKSQFTQTSTRWVKVIANTTLFQSDGETRIIFETDPKVLNSDIFYELEKTYDIVDGKHQGDAQNQTDVLPAISELDFFNCFSYANGVESYKIKDEFNATSMKIDTRPLAVYNEYKQLNQNASITYSEPYIDETNFNGLNVFNLSKGNFKHLNKADGSIRKIFFRDDNVLTLQEDKIGDVLYKKIEQYSVAGKPELISSTLTLGSYRAYAGKYGISNDEETFAYKGNTAYWIDSKRGCVLRLGGNGLEEISKNGMIDWFKDILQSNTFTFKNAVYDPYFEDYIIHIEQADSYKTLSFNEVPKGWISFYTFQPENMIAMNNDLFSFKDGELYQHNSNEVPRQEFYGESHSFDITTIESTEPTTDKIFKTFATESTVPFRIEIETNYTKGTIYLEEFIKKESWYYADIKQSEDDTDYSGFNANGIGNISAINGVDISLAANVGSNISIGDILLMQWAENDSWELGTITGINNNTITIDNPTNNAVVGKFIFATKNARVEGSEIRGYYLQSKLISSEQNPIELNGIITNVISSNV